MTVCRNIKKFVQSLIFADRKSKTSIQYIIFDQKIQEPFSNYQYINIIIKSTNHLIEQSSTTSRMGFEPILNYIVKNFTVLDNLVPTSFLKYFEESPSQGQIFDDVLKKLTEQYGHKQALAVLMIIVQRHKVNPHQKPLLQLIIGTYLAYEPTKIHDEMYLAERYLYYQKLEDEESKDAQRLLIIQKRKQNTQQRIKKDLEELSSIFKERRKQRELANQIKDKEKSQAQENLILERSQFKIEAQFEEILIKPLISPFNQQKEKKVNFEDTKLLKNQSNFLIQSEKIEKEENLNFFYNKKVEKLQQSQNQLEEKIVVLEDTQLKEILPIVQDQSNQLEEKVTPYQNQNSDQFLINESKQVIKECNNQQKDQLMINKLGKRIIQKLINQEFYQRCKTNFLKNQNFNKNECVIQPHIKKNFFYTEQSFQLYYYYQCLFKDELNPFKKKFFLSKFMGIPIENFQTYKILLSHKNKFQNERSNLLQFQQLINLELNKKRNQNLSINDYQFSSSNYRSLSFSLMFSLMFFKIINRRNQIIHGHSFFFSIFENKLRKIKLSTNVQSYQIKARKIIIAQENYWTHKIKKKNTSQEDY